MLVAPVSPDTHLKRIQAYIARMPSLSTTVAKVLAICNNPKASPNDLKRVISLDPVLSGQVLKLINSAYYGLPRPITSLTRAIIMLGLNTVKNLALSCAILETVGDRRASRVFDMQDFWAHSLCVGVTAKLLAVVKGTSLHECEDFFVAGLLHDLGKIPLSNQFPDGYFRVLDMSQRGKGTIYHCENTIFGMDHCGVGQMIAEKWKLGAFLIDALGHHHCPDQSLAQTRSSVSIVALANMFSVLLAHGAPGRNDGAWSMMAYLLAQTGLDWETLYDLRERVSDEIEKARIFLTISQKG
jgi:HD-like signal output (HDOD) protein